jgi:hypothetical protein
MSISFLDYTNGLIPKDREESVLNEIKEDLEKRRITPNDLEKIRQRQMEISITLSLLLTCASCGVRDFQSISPCIRLKFPDMKCIRYNIETDDLRLARYRKAGPKYGKIFSIYREKDKDEDDDYYWLHPEFVDPPGKYCKIPIDFVKGSKDDEPFDGPSALICDNHCKKPIKSNKRSIILQYQRILSLNNTNFDIIYSGFID